MARTEEKKKRLQGFGGKTSRGKKGRSEVTKVKEQPVVGQQLNVSARHETEGSLPCSQQPTTCPYPEPVFPFHCLPA